jgi:hypothetical protein
MSTAEADDASPDFSVDTLFGSSIQISPDSRQFSQMEEAGKPIWDVCDFSLPCTDHLMLRPDVPYSHAISQLASSGTPFSLSDFADICEPNDPDYVGTQSLFQRLLAPFRFSKSDIILTSGCTAAINVALAEFISDDHNEVILISPYDPESPQWVRLFHGRMVVVKSQYPDGGGNSWQLDVDAIIQKCSAQTSAILVVSPNAPTGVIYKPAILREFVA